MKRVYTEQELLAKSAKNRKAWEDAAKDVGTKIGGKMKQIKLSDHLTHVAHVSKSGKVGKFRPIPSVKKPSKYRNTKTEVDGIVFDSKKEAARWLELKALEASGKISRLCRQVRVPLKVNGVVVAHWVADFEYQESVLDPLVWEDVKSDYTRKLPVYRLKKKLVKAIYGVDIKET
jgi:hypothetical protein